MPIPLIEGVNHVTMSIDFASGDVEFYSTITCESYVIYCEREGCSLVVDTTDLPCGTYEAVINDNYFTFRKICQC